ncbi:MAG: hypothetical protein KF914_02885 [Rhizobiaceae bacterium]|nr:hypothetical protein [Rhizobiaceae bacterium]
MALLGHVLKRLVLAIIAYLVAMVVALIALALIYAAATSLAASPDHFTFMAVSPYIALAAPSLGLFALVLTIVLTCLQAAVTGLLSEIFALRNIWIHALFGAIVAASAYVLIAPVADAFLVVVATEIAFFAAAGAVGGLFYWLIAGHAAGFRR